jgi:hypothetical protein
VILDSFMAMLFTAVVVVIAIPFWIKEAALWHRL